MRNKTWEKPVARVRETINGSGLRRPIRRRDYQTVIRLLEGSRYEILPTATIEEKVHWSVPAGRTLTITASPAKGLEETLATSERLAASGYVAIPHIAARMVTGRSELEEIVARLGEAGITGIFVPGGDAQAAGDYKDALGLLEDLSKIDHGFTHIGVAGYPEPHPTISDDLNIQAMWDKRHYATHVVGNMTFDPEVVSKWVRRMRKRNISMPVLVGVPGPIDRAKLLSMATKIGVGDSTKFLAKHKGLMARLTAPGGFTGERFIGGFAEAAGEEGANVEGLHLYTFNQVAETEAWRVNLLEHLGAEPAL